MEVIMVSRVVVEGAAIVAAGVAFAEVVALYLSVVSTKPLPINFIQIIRLKDSTADDSSSRCSLDCEFNASKHDIPVGLNKWTVSLASYGECRSIRIIIGDTAGSCEFRRRSGCEVKLLVRLSKCGVRGASYDVLAKMMVI